MTNSAVAGLIVPNATMTPVKTTAVNRIRKLQGGAVLCAEGRVLAEVPLPLLGLMSDLPLPELVTRTDALAAEMKGLGFPFDEPLRPLMTLTGAAIPFIRISEGGLVDIKSGKVLDLFVDGPHQCLVA